MTPTRDPPSWEELGGPRLVQAAAEAGEPGVLLLLREGCAGGPYAAAVSPLMLLRSYAREGTVETAVLLVRGDGFLTLFLATSCLCPTGPCWQFCVVIWRCQTAGAPHSR